jgi:hypothetical protein
VWGGCSERERRRILKQRRVAAGGSAADLELELDGLEEPVR